MKKEALKLMDDEHLIKTYMEFNLTNKRVYRYSQSMHDFILLDSIDSVEFFQMNKPIFLIAGALSLLAGIYINFSDLYNYTKYYIPLVFIGLILMFVYFYTRKEILRIISRNHRMTIPLNKEDLENAQDFINAMVKAKEEYLKR